MTRLLWLLRDCPDALLLAVLLLVPVSVALL
jgi:hypothetical protein